MERYGEEGPTPGRTPRYRLSPGRDPRRSRRTPGRSRTTPRRCRRPRTPPGSRGRLGLLTYRTIRDIQQADEIQSGRGDEHIVDAYDRYDRDHRNDVLLFSNDRNFVERARSHRVLGQRVEFPDNLPDRASATWGEIALLVHVLAIVFGVVELPSVTVYGVWRGKDELDWQHGRVKLDPWSPKLESGLEGDLSVVESYEEFVDQ